MSRIRFAHMTKADADAFEPQPFQAQISKDERTQYLLKMAEEGEVWSFFAGDKLIGIGGLEEIWPTRASVWMLVSADAGRHMTALTRYLRGFIDAHDYKRVEMYVDANFRPGWRWASLLGFTCETPTAPMKGFMPNGNDAYLYARIQ